MPSVVKGFISEYDRDLHFEDHGEEFTPPLDGPKEYEAGAVAFLTKPIAGSIVEHLRIRDQHIVRYDPSTNELAICDADGAVRTYFKPNPAVHKEGDNLTYFRRRSS